jgi:rhodanese-related sulfurtransferase
MGWHLAGLKLDQGKMQHAPAPGPEGLKRAQEAARRVAERFGVRRIDQAGLARFRAEADKRSLYVLDVRSPAEYEAGHLPGSRSAPGGQLVQATDQYVGTLNARLVLIDGEAVRAVMTASWLIQMGWGEVYVLDKALDGQSLAKGREKAALLGDDGAVATITVDDLNRQLARATVVDLDTSLRYSAAHIPGAWFAIRARLADTVAKLPGDGPIVLTSPDGTLARVAARDLAPRAARAVLVLDGGTEAWRAAGYKLVAGDEQWADPPEDVWYKPYENRGAPEEKMREYLTWEVALVPQIERDGDANFRL